MNLSELDIITILTGQQLQEMPQDARGNREIVRALVSTGREKYLALRDQLAQVEAGRRDVSVETLMSSPYRLRVVRASYSPDSTNDSITVGLAHSDLRMLLAKGEIQVDISIIDGGYHKSGLEVTLGTYRPPQTELVTPCLTEGLLPNGRFIDSREGKSPPLTNPGELRRAFLAQELVLFAANALRRNQLSPAIPIMIAHNHF